MKVELLQVLVDFIHKTEPVSGPWLLGGSTSLKLLSGTGEPGDIDVFTDVATGAALSEVLQDALTSPWRWDPCWPYENWRAELKLRGIKIEIYGDLTIRKGNYTYVLSPREVVWAKRRVWQGCGVKINIIPVAEQILFNYLVGKKSYKDWLGVARREGLPWTELEGYWLARGVPVDLIKNLREEVLAYAGNRQA